MAASPPRLGIRARGLAPPVRGMAPFAVLVAALAVALTGCRSEPPLGTLSILLPEPSAKAREIVLRAAFAEYVELPELRRELRLTLASYELSCDRYVEPGPDDLVVMVTVVSPAAEPLPTGTVAAVSPEIVDGGEDVAVRRSVVTVARRADRSFVLPAGGTLEIGAFDPSPGGRLHGILALEFPGDGRSPAASVRGKFHARTCQPRANVR